MHNLIISQSVKLLASPDDGSPVILREHNGQQVLVAEGTGLLHPVIDGILILLSREDRCYELEIASVSSVLDSEDPLMAEAARRTLELLESRKGKTSFAWEDEEHWTREYASETADIIDDSKWNDRLWQRSPLVAAAGISGKISLVDVGCGEGQNFRGLLQKRISPDSLYIGADISLAGLRLNRRRNAWSNALFIVCSVDKLPLRPMSVDLICYFGILHHTENKAHNLPAHLNKLKPGGKVILHEAIVRARILGNRFRPHESAHEERFDVRDLQEEIRKHPELVRVTYWQTLMSIFCSASRRVFGSAVLLNPVSFKIITAVDRFCIFMLGPWLPWFRGGEVAAVLERPIGPQ